MLAPVLSNNSLKGENLIIIPDGTLHYVPFEALLTDSVQTENVGKFKNYHYLVEKHQISYAFSATMLHRMKNRKKMKESNNEILAFAAEFKNQPKIEPVENDTSAEEQVASLENLTKFNPWEDKLMSALHPINTKDHANFINEGFRAAVFSGPSATYENFLRHCSDYTIIDLFTHGHVNDTTPQFSNIAFEGGCDTCQNKLLYVKDLYNMDLNADLAVLAACNSGKGRIHHGEGMASVSRGFAYAGVNTLIASLWSIADKPTVDLFQEFYNHLADDETVDAALRQAKLEFINDPKDERFANPFYWAGPVAMGEMKTVTLRRNHSHWAFSLGGIACLLLIMGIIHAKDTTARKAA